MSISEKVEDIEKTCKILKWVMNKVRQSDKAAGIFVFIVAGYVNMLIDIMPVYLLKLIALLIAMDTKTDYGTIVEIWIIPNYVHIVLRFVVLCILAFCVYKEISVVFSGIEFCSLWYRILGCVIIILYAIAAVLGMWVFRYSEAALKNNWVFYPVLIAYVVLGVGADQYTKFSRAKELQEEQAIVKKKKHKKRKKAKKKN